MNGAIRWRGLYWSLRSMHFLFLSLGVTGFLGNFIRNFYREWSSDGLDVAKAHPEMLSHRRFIHLPL